MRKMTLDTLARMIQKGFLETAKQVNLLALEKRVDRLEQRVEDGFSMVAQEFKDIHNQLKDVDVRATDIFDLQLRMDKIEKKLKAQ